MRFLIAMCLLCSTLQAEGFICGSLTGIGSSRYLRHPTPTRRVVAPLTKSDGVDTARAADAPPVAPPTPKIVHREAGSVEVAGGEHDAPTAVDLYSASWCGPCQIHKAYWAARGWKGDGFVVTPVEVIPKRLEGVIVSIPSYHWNNKQGKGRLSTGISPEQFQSAFEQGEK